jgi:hypothetical protein
LTVTVLRVPFPQHGAFRQAMLEHDEQPGASAGDATEEETDG